MKRLLISTEIFRPGYLFLCLATAFMLVAAAPLTTNAGWADDVKREMMPPSSVEISYNEDIKGDYGFFWDEDHEWDPWKNRGTYRFYTLKGEIYSIRGQYSHGLDLFRFNRDKGRFDFIHQIYDDDYSLTGPEFDPVLFEFQDKYYAIHYFKSFVPAYQDTPDYEGRRFLLAYTTDINSHWQRTDDMPVDGRYNDFNIYRAACSDGEHVYLVYDSYVSDDTLHYHRNDIYIDKAVIDTDYRLKILDTFELHNVMERDGYHPYAVTCFTHADGNVRLLLSYCGENTSEKENKGGGVIVFSPEDDHYQHIYTSDDYAFSIRAIHGTIKGNRDNPSGDERDKDRIQVFYNHFTDGHWHGIHWIGDKGHFRYRTYAIFDDDYDLVAKGEIKLGDEDYYPDEWDRMNLDAAYRLHSVAQDDPDVGRSFHQRIWMFFTDGNGYIRGKGFSSDVWHHFEVVESNDLNMTDDDHYGEDIKKTWVLYGIIEGAPPCAIDWETWEENYAPQIHPSRISYAEGTTETYTATMKTDASWYLEMQSGNEFIEGKTKFSSWLEEEIGSSTTTTKETELSLVLNDEAQKLGVKMYIIPSVKRIAYATFPWWVQSYTREEAGKQPISYRFIAGVDRLHLESLALSAPLFNLDPGKLNDADLGEWKIDSNPGRQNLADNRDAAEILTLEWGSPGEGDTASFEIAKEESITTTHENELEVSVESKVPEVFRIGSGVSFTWSSSSQVTTDISKKIELSYGNLTQQKYGPKINGLQLTAYWFYDEDKIKDLWYHDYIEAGQHPWYIGYTVDCVNSVEEPDICQ